MSDPKHNDGGQDNQHEWETEEQARAGLGEAGRVNDNRIVRKTLTMASIGAVPERCVVAKEPVLIGRFFGIMFGTERQSLAADADKPDSQKTWFEAIEGDCMATAYLDDGAILQYLGGYCYMPGGFQERVIAMFRRLSDADRERGMDFDFQFAAVPARNPRGYAYVGRSLLAVSADEQNRRIEADLRTRRDGQQILIAAAKGLPGLVIDHEQPRQLGK